MPSKSKENLLPLPLDIKKPTTTLWVQNNPQPLREFRKSLKKSKRSKSY